MRRIFTIAVMGCAAAILAFTPAQAQLANSSFETGDLTGWTAISGFSTPTITQNFGLGGHVATDGSWFAITASNGDAADWGIYQTIPWSDSTAELRADISTTTGGVEADTSEYAGIRLGIGKNGGTDPGASSVVWSALTSVIKGDAFGEAAVYADGITASNITIFVQYISDPTDYTSPNDTNAPYRSTDLLGDWSFGVADNIRVSPLPTGFADNLSFETGDFSGWATHNAVDLDVSWFPGPFGHAISPVSSGFGLSPDDGGSFVLHAEAFEADKKAIYLQRFQTDIGVGTPDDLEVRVAFNRDGSAGVQSDQNIIIGIDPTGGVDPLASTVSWSGRLEDSGTGYTVVSHSVASPTDTIGPVATMFIEILPRFALNPNLIAIDNVELYVNGIQFTGPVVPKASVEQSWRTYR